MRSAGVAGLVAALTPYAGMAHAHEAGKLEAVYEASLAGIPVGHGTWTIDIGDDQFSASATGTTSGVMKAFAAAAGNGSSVGKVVDGELMPTRYLASITMYKKTELVRIALQNGDVRDFSIEPTPKVNPDRLVVTDAHRQGVVDPMTASLLHLRSGVDAMDASNCNSTRAIFDGRMRYDLAFTYKRTAQVKAGKGYAGPALVCSVRFSPVSGHVPARPAIKYLATQKQMEVWLVPLGSTRILVPFRIVIPTPVGVAMLEATEFKVDP